jgi:NADPH:quinone reductase-like Zn-dependent oxidoreductase
MFCAWLRPGPANLRYHDAVIGAPDEASSAAVVLEARDIDRPAIADDEVLVRVRAASVHVGDWILMTAVPYVMRMGTGLTKPKNPVPGTDVVGTVEAV